MNQRKTNELRPTTIEAFPTQAAGSVIIACGQTRVLCTASVSDDVPPFLPRDEQGNFVEGWLTAEYNMLPGSTPDRKRRKVDGRGTEIQRLIGRVLRAAVDRSKMPGVSITCDCDVLSADGGTRTAAITGAFVALSQAVAVCLKDGRLTQSPILGPVAATSVGFVDGTAYLDLDYPLDSRAEVDMNVAMNHQEQFIEVQGTGEQGVFSRGQLDELLDLATGGIHQLFSAQQEAIERLT